MTTPSGVTIRDPFCLNTNVNPCLHSWLTDNRLYINPWTKVRFENTGFITEENRAIAMGNYFFTDLNGNEAKVEFTFGYTAKDGQLKIDLHHSSFPYNP